MKSYTGMSDEAVMATIDAMQEQCDDGYEIRLNHGDFSQLMWALRDAFDLSETPAVSEWAASFASGIGETLGIEYV